MKDLNSNIELLAYIKQKIQSYNIKDINAIIAGGSICAWVNEFINKVPAVINDIDLFNVKTEVKNKTVKIIESRKDGLINTIDIILPPLKATETIENQLLKTFDLNCTQCSYSIKDEKLSYTEAFTKWLESRVIEIVFTGNSFPLGSILRAHRKASELGSKYYHQDDIKMYLWLYRAVFCFNSLNATFPILNDDSQVLGFFIKNKDAIYLKSNPTVLEPHLMVNLEDNNIKINVETINAFKYYKKFFDLRLDHHFDWIASNHLAKFPAQDFKESIYIDIAYYAENNINLCLENGTEQLFKNFSKKIEKRKFNKCSSFFKLHSEINKYNFILLFKLKWSVFDLLSFYYLLDKENYLVIGHWEVLIKNNFQSDYFNNENIACTRETFISYLKNQEFNHIIDTIKKIVNYEFKDNELTIKTELPTNLKFANELTTIKELRDEGILMNHCVGGYTQLVKNAHSKIFHIRSENEDSTVEFNQMLSLNEEFKDDTLVWSVNQHKGKYNREPSLENKELVNILMKYLNTIS